MIRVHTTDGLDFMVSADAIMGVAPVLDAGPLPPSQDGKLPDPRLLAGAKPIVNQVSVLTLALPPLTVNATAAEVDEAVLEDRRRTDRWVNAGEHTPAVSVG